MRLCRAEYAQGQIVAISREQQILPGSFEHALSFVVDNKLDFSNLDEVPTHEEAGAPADNPRVVHNIR